VDSEESGRRGEKCSAIGREVPKTSLLAGDRDVSFPGMSTVAEIENAIERLSPEELSDLAGWFEEYQQMVGASAEIFAMYDREEEASCRKRNAGNCGD